MSDNLKADNAADGGLRLTHCCASSLTRYDVGKLKPGMRVTAAGKLGTVRNVHEPSWVDHRTRAFQQELQSADIVLDDEPTYASGLIPARSFPCGEIQILHNKLLSNP